MLELAYRLVVSEQPMIRRIRLRRKWTMQSARTTNAIVFGTSASLDIFRLGRNGFCLFGKPHKSDSPRSCIGGKRYRDAKATIFCRSDRWEGTTGLKKNRARRRDIPGLGLPIQPLSKREP